LFAAATALAVPLLAGAQQQTPNPRSGWPCGARLDPSYFRVAEGTGGHLLLAGAVTPGLHEIPVRIDSSIESVLFSISVQCLQTADVVRPSGAAAIGDDVTLLPNFRAEHMVIVRRPEPGVWTLRVVGSGIGGIVVQAQSALTIIQVEFAQTPAATFTTAPVAGVEQTMRIRVRGHPSDLRAAAVSGTSERLADLPLAATDIEGSYVSRFTPTAEPFRVLVTGRDADGVDFQRMSAPLITPRR
jgi:hypothetical protein